MQNPSDIIYTDNLFQKIFVVEGDNTVSITNGFIRNNKVVLQLNKSSCKITGLTYNSDIYTQPWVKNKLNMGLISFYNVPILKNQIQPYYTGCKQALISMGEDSIPGCKYLWKRASTKQNYTSARIRVKGDSVEAFSLIISYGSTVCKLKDTMTVYLSPDPVKVPELGKNDTICKGDTLLLQPDYFGFNQFKWNSSLGSTYQAFYNVTRTEKVLLTSTSQWQCVYKDSVQFNVSSPMLSMPESLYICEGTDTLITAPAGFKSYTWNGQAGYHSFRSGQGNMLLQVSNDKGCKTLDTIEIIAFKETAPPLIFVELCKNDKRTIPLPAPFMMWYYQSIKIEDSLKVSAGKNYPILLIDSNNCNVTDTLRTTGLSVPEFTMGKDTGFCKTGKVTLQLPYNMEDYLVNNTPISNPVFDVAKPGIYIAKVKNSNHCSYSDTIIVTEYLSPDLGAFRDTVLCRDSIWKPQLRSDWKYFINGAVVQNGYQFSIAGDYLVKAVNRYQCVSTKTIIIGQKECKNNHLTTYFRESVRLYPNPISDQLFIISTFESGTPAVIYNAEGRSMATMILQRGANVFDLSAYSTGYYFIEISGYHFKLLKN